MTYTLVIKRTLSSDASLKALTLSSGALSPVFAPGTKSYKATVATTVSMITVTPTVNDPKATIKIRNVPVSSGSPSQPLFLSMGDNTIDVKVTAEDGSLQTYTITVRRSSNACEILSIVNPSDAYKSGSDWRLGVGNDTTAVHFEVLVSPFATWKLYRDPFCTSEIAYATMQNLVEGDNTAYIKVVAEDGTVKLFRLIVTRGGPSRSSNNRIQYLVLNGGTLNPYFSPYITSYTAHVPYETTSVTVRVTTEFARADIRVNGKWIVSGGTSAPISLFEGDNTLSIAIMAETVIAVIGFVITRVFPEQLMSLFNSNDAQLISFGAKGLRIFLMMLPIIGFQIASSNYFQAVGKPRSAMFLSLSRQVVLLIPALLILPRFFGLDGVLYSGPVADLGSSIVTGIWLFAELRHLDRKHIESFSQA
jgi:hypothetical protein